MDNEHTNDVRLVGRKSKLPLLLIIAALAAALLAYAMWKSMESTDAAPVGNSAQEARSQDDLADAADTIAGIYAVGTVSELHNENFELKGAIVASVVSDRVFYVTEEGNTQQLLVHLDEDLDEGAAEGRVQIQAGQRLDVKGELKDAAQNPIEAGDDYTDAEAAAASGQRVYLHATNLELK